MPDAGYAFAEYNNTLWDGSQTITIAAAGDSIPAFSSTLHSPTAVTVTAPLPASNGSYTVNRASDLIVSWSGGNAGDLLIVEVAAGVFGTLTCAFDATLGTGTIPSSTLSALPSGQAVLGIFSGRRDTKTVGAYTVRIRVESEGRTTGTFGYSFGLATLQ
jgi:hypothetical protein